MKWLYLIGAVLLTWAGAPAEESPPKVFSGQVSSYQDTYNGYQLSLPVEFQSTGKGATSTWEGPRVDDFATTIFVNCTPMPGVHPQALYDGILRAKKTDRGVTEVTPVKMSGKLKNKPIFAFRCKEVATQSGSATPKEPGDFHRWYLYVWGNDCAYELAVCGSYKALGQGQELPPVYERVIQSFRLIPQK